MKHMKKTLAVLLALLMLLPFGEIAFAEDGVTVVISGYNEAGNIH